MLNKIVTKPNSVIRAEAREHLRGKWKTAVLFSLIYLIIVNLPVYMMGKYLSEGASGLFSFAYSIAVGGPLMYGFSLFVLKIIRQQNAEISDLFEGFNCYGTTVVLSFLMNIFIILWALLLVIPGIIASIRYSQAYFILIDHPKISASEAINRSKQMMRGNIGKLFVLGLSFIGWMILSALTLGIGGLWLTPYMFVSLAVFYTELIGGQESKMTEEGSETSNENNTIE